MSWRDRVRPVPAQGGSWKDRVFPESVDGATASAEGISSPPPSPAIEGGDASIRAIQERARAQNPGRVKTTELEALLLGLGKGLSRSMGDEIGSLLGTNEDDRRAAREAYIKAGKAYPGIFTLGETAGQAPLQTASGVPGAILGGAAGAVDALGRSTDKANAVDEALTEGVLGALFTGPGVKLAKSVARKATDAPRTMLARSLDMAADVIRPGSSPAQAASRGSVKGAVSKVDKIVRPIPKASDFLSGDMGMEVFPQLRPGIDYSADVPARLKFFTEQIGDKNSALSADFVDKLAKTPGGLDALIEGPSSDAAKRALASYKERLSAATLPGGQAEKAAADLKRLELTSATK